MRIYIPTLGRVGRQGTLEKLPKKLLELYAATLVCPKAEVPQHLDQWYGELVDFMPCEAKGIGATREAIIKDAVKNDPIVLMLDDDLSSWAARREQPDGEPKYSTANEKELIAGFKEFSSLMKTRAHGSIGHRLFAQALPPIYYNKRMLRALAYDARILTEHKVRARITVMEDFDVQLQLMKLGFESVTYNKIVQDQRASQAPGGCSTYRTIESQGDAARELARLHPDCVKVVERTVKNGWNGGTRTDVQINWRKALRRK